MSEKEVFTAHERIQSTSHQGKKVVLANISNCSAVEVAQIVRAVPDYVTAQPLGSVLLLVDFTGASFDQDALRAMKECAVFDKPYIKKATWVGGGNPPHGFEKDLKDFSRREFPSRVSDAAVRAVSRICTSRAPSDRN